MTCELKFKKKDNVLKKTDFESCFIGTSYLNTS